MVSTLRLLKRKMRRPNHVYWGKNWRVMAAIYFHWNYARNARRGEEDRGKMTSLKRNEEGEHLSKDWKGREGGKEGEKIRTRKKE